MTRYTPSQAAFRRAKMLAALPEQLDGEMVDRIAQATGTLCESRFGDDMTPEIIRDVYDALRRCLLEG